MDALILAAGRGTRLGLQNTPKCLMEFEGSSLIEYQIKCLKQLGIKQIFVVVGYESEKIKQKLGNNVSYINNENFATTNNIHSIFKAKTHMKNDFICLYGDLFFHINILKKCMNSKKDMTLMIEKELRDETTKVKIQNDKIVQVNKKIEKNVADGNFIGMMKCSKEYLTYFFQSVEFLVNDNSQAYYTIAIEKMINDGIVVNFDITDGFPWTDIDTHEDLLFAKKVFSYN